MAAKARTALLAAITWLRSNKGPNNAKRDRENGEEEKTTTESTANTQQRIC